MYDDWTPVEVGRTAASVRRSPDGRAYAKTGTDETTLTELAAERDRIEWLAGTGVPGPRVLEWTGFTLVTSAVPGVPACDVAPGLAAKATAGLTEALRALHALPVASCPFDRTINVTVEAARHAASAGLVDLEDLDAERRGRSVADLLAELIATRPATEDLVVCHGDSCLPNVLVDPGTGRVTGWVDLGRLGVADRHQDLALLTRSMSSTRLNPAYGEKFAAALLEAYPGEADPDVLAWYRLLDEFF